MKKSSAVVLTLITALASSCTTEKQVDDKEVLPQDTTKTTAHVSSTPVHHTTVYPWYLFWRNWGTPKPATRGGFGKNGIGHSSTS